MRSDVLVITRGRTALTLLSALWLAACSPSLAPVATVEPTDNPYDQPTDTPSGPRLGGNWSGTITFHGLIDTSKEESGHNDQDPNSAYYATFDRTETEQSEATDTFAVTGAVDGDSSSRIKLGGTADNEGNMDYRKHETGTAGNSCAKYDYESGTEATGSWSGAGKAEGEITLSSDGHYAVDIRAVITKPDGYEPDSPTVPWHDWSKTTNVVGCAQPDVPDTTEPGPTSLWWVSSIPWDEEGRTISIEGQADPANPGSTLDGSSTWKVKAPEVTITLEWHLVHDSPLVWPEG
jgi:hypothetical protein